MKKYNAKYKLIRERKEFIVKSSLADLKGHDYVTGVHNKNKGREAQMEMKEYKLSEPVRKGDMSIEEAIANRRSIRTYSEEDRGKRYIPVIVGRARHY